VQRTEKDVDGNDELKEQGARFINGNRGNTFEQSQWIQVTGTQAVLFCLNNSFILHLAW